MNTTKRIAYEKELLKIAEISAKSTIKYLWEMWALDYTSKLRYGLLSDVVRLERERNVINEISNLEKRVNEIDEETKITLATIREMKDIIEELEGERYLEIQGELIVLNEYVERLHKERITTIERINELYKYLGERLTDGIDLYHIAICAIWECMPIIKAYARHNKLDVENIGKLVVECVTVKKTGEKKYITLKAYADGKVRRYINKWRSGTESKTQYIIVGYDDEGNELLLQNSKLETLGGIDSIEEKHEFSVLWGEIEKLLSARQLQIVKYLLQGMNQTQIANKLNVKQNTISDTIKRIREKLKNSNIEQVKKYLA